MKALEYDKKEPAFRIIDNKTKKYCEINNIDYFEYIGVFIPLLSKYIKKKALVAVIEKLDFSDKISTRAVLNKAHFLSKETELYNAKIAFDECKEKMFNWLNKTKDPYFFILNPFFKYGAGIQYKGFGYLKVRETGASKENLCIAEDYAKYKIVLTLN